ncbi:MAG: hypothetical protein ACFFCP_03670 [Promethearchaeota archaeon]
MSGATLMTIGFYFVVRVALHFDETRSKDSVARLVIIWGAICFAVGTAFYWMAVLNYVPCSMCFPPIPIVVYLAWVTFLLADSLYQLLVLSRVRESTVLAS